MAQVKFLKVSGSRPTQHNSTVDDLTILSLSSDTINERTAAAGVTIDGVLVKDNGITATGQIDFGSAVMEIPNDAAPVVDAVGETALDTSITNFQPSIVFNDGSTTHQVVSFLSADLASPTDGDSITYDATNDKWVLATIPDEDDSNSDEYNNDNAGAIALGDAVFLSAANAVDLADSDDPSHGDKFVGLVLDASIAPAASGRIHTSQGKLLVGASSAKVAGDIIVLSKTATTGNTLTTTIPSGDEALFVIGVMKNATDLIYGPRFVADLEDD